MSDIKSNSHPKQSSSIHPPPSLLPHPRIDVEQQSSIRPLPPTYHLEVEQDTPPGLERYQSEEPLSDKERLAVLEKQHAQMLAQNNSLREENEKLKGELKEIKEKKWLMSSPLSESQHFFSVPSSPLHSVSEIEDKDTKRNSLTWLPKGRSSVSLPIKMKGGGDSESQLLCTVVNCDKPREKGYFFLFRS